MIEFIAETEPLVFSIISKEITAILSLLVENIFLN